MPVQRWRLTYARGPDAPDLPQREQQSAWLDALESAGLRDVTAPEPAKLVPAAPIPNGLTADRELADLFLGERRTSADVRDRLAAAMPAGHRLVDVHDVWLGEPALPGLVTAGDYRVDIAGTDGTAIDDAALASSVRAFLAASAIERMRGRADRPDRGNLRILVRELRLLPDGGLWMRLVFDPAIGTARPEEVVAALAALGGVPLAVVGRRRERLWLRGEEPPEPASTFDDGSA